MYRKCMENWKTFKIKEFAGMAHLSNFHDTFLLRVSEHSKIYKLAYLIVFGQSQISPYYLDLEYNYNWSNPLSVRMCLK